MSSDPKGPLTADENAEMRKVGFKPTKAENPDFRCRRCQSDDVWYRDIDTNPAFDDVEYRCLGCGRRWYFESADS